MIVDLSLAFVFTVWKQENPVLPLEEIEPGPSDSKSSIVVPTQTWYLLRALRLQFPCVVMLYCLTLNPFKSKYQVVHEQKFKIS